MNICITYKHILYMFGAFPFCKSDRRIIRFPRVTGTCYYILWPWYYRARHPSPAAGDKCSIHSSGVSLHSASFMPSCVATISYHKPQPRRQINLLSRMILYLITSLYSLNYIFGENEEARGDTELGNTEALRLCAAQRRYNCNRSSYNPVARVFSLAHESRGPLWTK